MEDYQEQEYEFLRRLEEERIGRRTLLKRGLARRRRAHDLSLSATALRHASRRRRPAVARDQGANLTELVRQAKKEGRLNTIALPPDWANYGEIMSTFTKKYGIPITNDNPDGTSAQENQAVVSLKGDSRPPTSSTSARRSRSPAPSRACTRSTSTATSRPSRAR